MRRRLLMTFVVFCLAAASARANECVDCHRELQPKLVADWETSKHSAKGIACAVCHGSEHRTSKDAAKAHLPTPETCGQCHTQQVKQFSAGKHALAWSAMEAMPTTHLLPMALTEGQKGCGGCHKVGLKNESELKNLKAHGSGYGVASCDSCHTRHAFSKREAQQPQACQTCHMGFDHPQWEMYSTSKHGVRALLKQTGVLGEEVAAPTCQTCHMKDGNHEVRTAWGFLAVRLPLPEDEQWKQDQVTILQALGVLDPEGQPTARLDVVKAADVARLTEEDFKRERDKMIGICSQCHAKAFAEGELAKGDEIIRQADHLLAQAIRVVADLYRDNVLSKPEGYGYAFPDLLAFHHAPRPIEQRLFVMHLKHRMRTFQGTFHANPDYALWYGWSEMVRDLSEIQEMAQELRARHQGHGQRSELESRVASTSP